MSLSYEQYVLMKKYLSQRAMAVVGASNERDKFGNLVCRELKIRGFRVYPVNPHEKEICSERCYRTINELGDRIDRILIVLPPILTEQIIMKLNPAIISYVWMQNGAESSEAIQVCHSKGIKTIYGQCILMHAEPVRSYHLLHRWWTMLATCSIRHGAQGDYSYAKNS
jgi:predicted CoA-binding protein